uniref:Xaa-Pro dipeptidase n=1 Tax=Kalanchoe fedtschenkoi TaxID=63787 RepID=A0A7N0UY93_KALFE
MAEQAIAVSMATSRLSPPQVEMVLHVTNRSKLVKFLRRQLIDSGRPLRGFVLLQGGEEQMRHCTDHCQLFRQESYFSYLFGVREPGFYGAIDVVTGDSFLFIPKLPEEYAVWLGKIKPLSYFKETYLVEKVFYIDQMVEVLHAQKQQSEKVLLFLLHGLNTDSGNYSKPAEFKGIDKFEKDLNTLHPIVTECRVVKTNMELSLIQFANDISSEAHVEVMRNTRIGMKEYQLESMFLHHTYMYGGCRNCSYTCICATGDNSAILHYGHAAAPNDRVNGKFTADQSLVYGAVLDAHNVVISSMRPGVSWVDMHKLAERVILESLRNGFLLFGDVDEMMLERLGAMFMPHGLGHLLGIDTHDPGGYPKDVERPKEFGLKSLRTARKLEEGMVITVEPGCYFIDALLVPAMENPRTSRFFNHELINKFRGFGGVRIESDLHITSEGCMNMTNVPREISEIEAVMAGAPWPIN